MYMMKGPGGSFGFGPRSALAILILFVSRQNACQCFTLLNSLWSFRSTAGIFVRKGAGQQLQLTNQPHPISNDCTGRNITQNCIDESDTNVFKGQIVSNNIMAEESTDFVGAGTLGDIMSDPSDVTKCKEVMQNGSVFVETRYVRDSLLAWNVTANRTEMRKVTSSGLVTSTGGTLTAQFGQKIPNLSPLDRIALTANGNLQRIFSSFYDAPVHVHIDKCVKRGFGLDYSCDHDEYYNLDNQDGGGDAVWDRVVHLSVFGQIFCKAASNITVHSVDCIRLVESGEVGLGQLFRYLDKLPTFTILDAGRCENGGLWRRYKLECKELTCEILEEFVPDAWKLQETLE